MLGALLRDGVGRSEEDIGEQAWLYGRDVGKPTAHNGMIPIFNYMFKTLDSGCCL